MYAAASTAGLYTSRKHIHRPSMFTNKSKPSVIIDPVTFMSGKRLILNVSGCRYRINEYHLKQYPETLLGSSEREYFYDETKGEYFFDRDPQIFKQIYNFYKSGKLHYSEQDCFESFTDELTFFRISIDDVSACCGEALHQRLGEVETKKERKIKEEKAQNKSALKVPVAFREKVWQFLEEPQLSLFSKVCYYFSCVVIVISVACNTWETVPCDGDAKCDQVHPEIFFTIDSTCVGIFTFEYLLRFYVTPDRWKYFKSPMALVDLAAILPYYIDLAMAELASDGAAVSAMNVLVTLRVLRIFRVFKLARHSKKLRELSESLKKSASELGFILFTYLIVVVLFASVLFYAERYAGDTKFTDIPQSMWYTVVTTTTLG